MPNNALIGYTGFVGKNLKHCYHFKYLFNSSNINEIVNNSYDTIMCAAPSAVKWRINNNPFGDLRNIVQLISLLEKTNFKRLILFSTVDVYGDNSGYGYDEDYDPNLKQHYYGFNRLIFEKYILGFDNSNIIRLPALFGEGLKKNIIFDLCNDNMIDKISLNTKFQWLDLALLPKIIDVVIDGDIRLLNATTEPVNTREIVETFFPDKLLSCTGESSLSYDIRTKYSKNYLYEKEEIMKSLEIYLNGVK
ncbi:MAG: NAD-dependent epimerase/dehydratase family protein [Candidatus Hodarchaeales archaeon]|jgi:hypothetical protein